MAGDKDACYPIRAVVRMTGVGAATLRAWERRYGLVEPSRSESGQRLYSPADVERIRRIVTMVDNGISPSRVADALALQESGEAALPGDWQSRLDRLMDAVSSFDDAALDDVFREAMATHTLADVTEELTIPALKRVGARWEEGTGLVAEEHFFRLYIRNAIGSRLFHRERRSAGPILVCACVPGERHDIGLLLFCLNAEAAGYRVVNLGADTPLDDLPDVVDRVDAAAVVLAANYDDSVSEWAEPLERLAASVPIPVFVGGRQLEAHEDRVIRTGALSLGTRIRQGVAELQRRLAGAG